MTHFLLPVGGAITLTPNSHIYALGIIQRTKPWSLIKIRQCMWMLLDASCLSFFAINSSPRHGQTVRDIKNILAILRPQCLEIMFTEFGGNRVVIFRGVYQIPEHAFFKQPWIADFLWAEPMTCSMKVVRLNEIYMCTEFIWIRASMCELYIKFSDCVLGGAVEPLCHARVPASVASGRQQIPTCVRIFKSFWAC